MIIWLDIGVYLLLKKHCLKRSPPSFLGFSLDLNLRRVLSLTYFSYVYLKPVIILNPLTLVIIVKIIRG